MPKVSLIVTVYNEAKSIEPLIASISKQTRLPNETIIVDGGSTDSTLVQLKKLKKKYPTIGLRLYTHTSNRSGGRNFAISHAVSEWIACTDAGCVLEPQWLEELVKKQLQTKALVVAGYYKAAAGTPLQEAIAPYALVMPDKVDPMQFLPATRSMLFHKQTVFDAGGFDETLDVSEDYALAQTLKNRGVSMQFAPFAVAVWEPRATLGSFFSMVISMAQGDVLAGVVRPKALFVVLRYICMFALGFFVLAQSVAWGVGLCMFFAITYAVWAVSKNKKYVPRGYYYLPVLQVLADLGVMLGLVRGYYQKILSKNFSSPTR